MRCLSILVAGLVLLVLAALPAPAQKPAAAWLITPDEAALADAPLEAPPPKVRLRGKTAASPAGPVVEMVNPVDGQPTRAPVSIYIKFTPNPSPIDLATLKVQVLKIIKIDITDRLRPYVKPDGIHIDDGRIPAGHYRLRLSLADVDGHQTTGDGELIIE